MVLPQTPQIGDHSRQLQGFFVFGKVEFEGEGKEW
jgi:hypothetical protein